MTTRRDRLRDATSLEIRETARRHLRAGGPSAISLRGIARDLGMTAPALYRYYASLDDLIASMIEGYKNEISDALETARDAQPPDALGARLVAMSRAFRRWALEHRAEFGMVFGAPVPGYTPPVQDPAEAAGERFSGVFFAVFAELWLRRRFPVPGDERIPPALRDALGRFGALCGAERLGLPLGLQRMFAGAWVRLYGLVAMEVFGHLTFLLDDAEALFEAELAELAETMGLPPSVLAPSAEV